jgi:hypothetical protein
MGAVLLAMFDQYEIAGRVRVDLASKQEFRGGCPSELGLAQTEVTIPGNCQETVHAASR